MTIHTYFFLHMSYGLLMYGASDSISGGDFTFVDFVQS